MGHPAAGDPGNGEVIRWRMKEACTYAGQKLSEFRYLYCGYSQRWHFGQPVVDDDRSPARLCLRDMHHPVGARSGHRQEGLTLLNAP